ncbi:MAG: lysophospholipid acyltransferase family protein [Acidobacteriaceae bacterium]|nr:lysophospholipid acyltransferase family protein [Acidobacteriaceae bacterium]
MRTLPLSVANALAGGAVRVLDMAVPKLRRVGLINLSFAFPQTGEQAKQEIVEGVFRTIARMLVAMARFPDLNASNIEQWIGYEGLENYVAAKKEGRGVLVATAHLGNWELSAFAHALMTEPMNVMVRPLDNPLIDDLVEKRRTASGNRLIFKKDGARAVLKAVRNNEAVGILIDQNTSVAEGAFIEFFGKTACAGTAFVKLAYHSGAAVIPGFALWDERAKRYILRFCPRIELSGDLAADTQRIHSFFEAVIREHPEQWMWIHRRWKTRPEGEPGIY